MNDLLLYLPGAWKPLLTALLLPPVPWLLLIALGARWLWRRRRAGWWLVLPSLAALWLGSTTGAAEVLTRLAGLEATALPAARIDALAAAQPAASAPARPTTAIVVLGGGRDLVAPEYGEADLSSESLRRLRYGLWLSRATGLPVAFSGGHGWSQPQGESEAGIAARVAAREFGQPLRWLESRSRDTRSNARLTLPLLRADGVRHVVLVTHGWHMNRALRAFGEVADGVTIEPAPIDLALDSDVAPMAWLPSGIGQMRCRQVLREWVALQLGA
ncbi:MAG: YdcF family protein [Ideonella sp.]|nr:YdcF family protein [Ideonella sp.]